MTTSLTREQAHTLLETVRTEIAKGVVGQTNMIDGLLTALLTGGHVLIEGVPGLAKTRAVNLLAAACGATFKRIQFTPDLLPADVVGTQIYNMAEGKFSVKKGPIFSNVVLADEINRAPAKVQSALLEAMQEHQVTLGDETFALPKPFFVFATQNPIEQEGTYPLPEAQVDRFLLKLIVDYPIVSDEKAIVKMVMEETHLPEVKAVLTPASIVALQNVTRKVFVEDKIIDYITDLVFTTREPEKRGLANLKEIIACGASPRASISLAAAARAHAILANRDMVLPDDVKSVAPSVLRHRVAVTYQADAEGISSEQIVSEILSKVRVP